MAHTIIRGLIYDVSTLLGLPGLLMHEGTHWGFGKLFGGNPFVYKRRLGVPTGIDYKTPSRMSNNEVRITGGLVAIYPLFLAFFLGLNYARLLDLNLVELLIIYLLWTASGFSWLDALALWEPEMWVNFTEGNPITREMSEQA